MPALFFKICQAGSLTYTVKDILGEFFEEVKKIKKIIVGLSSNDRVNFVY